MRLAAILAGWCHGSTSWSVIGVGSLTLSTVYAPVYEAIPYSNAGDNPNKDHGSTSRASDLQCVLRGAVLARLWVEVGMGVPEIGLADAIKSLRAELSKALTEGEKEAVHFRLGPVELEFVVGITVGGQVGGGVKFWVLSVDAGGSASRSSQHRIKLTLQPIGAEGELEVSSEEGERPE